jgi:hypothetical protein
MNGLWLRMGDHWFWWLMTAAVMLWYSTITIYIAVKGVGDIKTMLRRLASYGPGTENSQSPSSQRSDQGKE